MENATFNQTDVVSASMDCAEVQEGILASFSFWIEGITQVNIAMVGIIFNLVSMVILMDKEMRNRYVSKKPVHKSCGAKTPFGSK